MKPAIMKGGRITPTPLTVTPATPNIIMSRRAVTTPLHHGQH